MSGFEVIKQLAPNDILHKVISKCTFRGRIRDLPSKVPSNAIYEMIDGTQMEGMEQKYDGNIWDKPKTQTRSMKDLVLRKSACGRVFKCMNERCPHNKSTKQAALEWIVA